MGWTHPCHVFFYRSLQSVSHHLLGYWFNHVWVRTPFSKKDGMTGHSLTYWEPQGSSPRGKTDGLMGPKVSWALAGRDSQSGEQSSIHTRQAEKMPFQTHHWALEWQSWENEAISTPDSPGNLVVSCFYNYNTRLLWRFPAQVLGEAQIIMVMQPIICLT